MTLKAETPTQIQTVLHADPALQVQLKSCTDADSAATLIVKAASDQGIELSKADIVACGKASPSLHSAAISDNDLDLVAGGKYDPGERLRLEVRLQTRQLAEESRGLQEEIMNGYKKY